VASIRRIGINAHFLKNSIHLVWRSDSDPQWIADLHNLIDLTIPEQLRHNPLIFDEPLSCRGFILSPETSSYNWWLYPPPTPLLIAANNIIKVRLSFWCRVLLLPRGSVVHVATFSRALITVYQRPHHNCERSTSLSHIWFSQQLNSRYRLSWNIEEIVGFQAQVQRYKDGLGVSTRRSKELVWIVSRCPDRVRPILFLWRIYGLINYVAASGGYATQRNILNKVAKTSKPSSSVCRSNWTQGLTHRNPEMYFISLIKQSMFLFSICRLTSWALLGRQFNLMLRIQRHSS